MKRMIRKVIAVLFFFLIAQNLFSGELFNKNLTDEERETLKTGQVLIKNIAFQKKMCLNSGCYAEADALISEIKALNPKYLAEIIQIKPYKGNENLPDVLEELLYNVSDYEGIPYYSVRAEGWYNLYDSAEIKSEKILNEDEKTIEKEIQADFVMSPFGTIHETIILKKSDESVYYSAINNNKLRYFDEFDCV